VLTFDKHSLRRVAQFAPYESFEILVNNRTYGGGGISSLSTSPLITRSENYVSFMSSAHHFAGLADEYYTSSVAYASSAERVRTMGNQMPRRCSTGKS